MSDATKALGAALIRTIDGCWESDQEAEEDAARIKQILADAGLAIVPVEPTWTDTLKILRDRGWVVAIHNDYWLSGERHTFWLLTHKNGTWVKGEDLTDAEALEKALKVADAWVELRAAQETGT